MTGGLTPQQVAEGQRNALALLAAAASGDFTGIDALKADTVIEMNARMAGLFTLLLDALGELGADPAEWAARKQAELLVREAEDGKPA